LLFNRHLRRSTLCGDDLGIGCSLGVDVAVEQPVGKFIRRALQFIRLDAVGVGFLRYLASFSTAAIA